MGKEQRGAIGMIFTLRALAEGKVPILLAVLLCLAGSAITWWFGLVLLPVLVLTVAFFRDPQRASPPDPDVILAPADGRVVEIRREADDVFVGREAIRVAVFLSVFDVHVQRMPVDGVIRGVEYKPGGHLDARDARAGLLNESRLLRIETEDGLRLTVRQIAGKVARRIVGWAREGEALARGERFGMIRFGSRVEICLPPEVEVVVRLNQHVRGGETVLARRR